MDSRDLLAFIIGSALIIIIIYIIKIFIIKKSNTTWVYGQQLSKECSQVKDIYKYINPQNPHPKIIWTFWHNHQFPNSVCLSIKSWKKYNPQYTICAVTLDNLYSYIKPQELPSNFDSLIIPKKSDVIRILLLIKYGGVWLDSTFYTFKSLDDVIDLINYDYCGFYIEGFTTNHYYPVIENWFMASKPQSEFLIQWKNEFFKILEHQNQFDNNGQTREELDKKYFSIKKSQGVDFQNIPDNIISYLNMHCAIQIVMQQEFKKYNIKLMPSFNTQGPYKYINDHGWDSHKAIETLISQHHHPHFSFVKFRGSERKITDNKWNNIHPDSLFGKLISLE